jgi:Zn-dependent protease/CBS domain-containing protein
MPGTIRLGRFHDVDIGLHVTFLPVLAWAAWLGTIQYGGIDGAAFGTLAVMLLFACVLLHEVAHSVQANACGIEVQYIVLLPIGGLASLDVAAIKPRDEVRIALSGPLANLGLGAILAGVILMAASGSTLDVTTLTLQSLQQPSILGLLAYLAMANLTLGLFNLLPAFPLDGGRALRAALSVQMPFEAATHRAAIAGRSVGAGRGAVGVMLLLMGGLTDGLALTIVATVLYAGATYEDRIVRRHAALYNWTVGQLPMTSAQTVTPDEPLSSTLDTITRGGVVPVVVGEQSRLVGLVTAHELLRMAGHGTFDDLSVAHAMRTRFPTVRPADPLWIAYEKLQRFQLFTIPVVERSSLCGLVTLSDIRQVLRSGKLPQPGPGQHTAQSISHVG